MGKKRLLFYDLVDFIDNDKNQSVGLIAGTRVTGKTELLKQLKAHYGVSTRYHDVSRSDFDIDAVYDDFLDETVALILIDEISYLKDYETTCQMFFNQSQQSPIRKKIIITGSSLSHIIALSSSKLGCRSKLFRLPQLTFIEYLYFTHRIDSYKSYHSVQNSDFVNYLQMKDMEICEASGLAVVFDENYFRAFYSEVEISNRKSRITSSLVDLQEDDLQSLANVLAYKLSEATQYEALKYTDVRGQEYQHIINLGLKPPVRRSKLDISDLPISKSFFEFMHLSPKDIGRIFLFLCKAGFVTLEYERLSDDDTIVPPSSILTLLENVACDEDLISLFKRVSLCLTSPLLYTNRRGHNQPNGCGYLLFVQRNIVW